MENDLIRRSELLAKKCMVRGHLDTGSPCPSKVTAIPADVIERAPAVDAVEVVRCRHCKHFDWNKMECENDAVSTDHEGGASYSLNFCPEDFCSYGERKKGAEDG